MSIQKNKLNSKQKESTYPSEKGASESNIGTNILILILFILLGFASFALGRLSVATTQGKSLLVETIAPKITEEATTTSTSAEATNKSAETEVVLVVGSKNSDKYHFPWCSGAKRISEKNLVTFSTYEEARGAGYVPAKNCDGLK